MNKKQPTTKIEKPHYPILVMNPPARMETNALSNEQNFAGFFLLQVHIFPVTDVADLVTHRIFNANW